MILIAAPPRPALLRIERIITVDEDGDERWWSLEDLRREHPYLFVS